MPQSDNGCATYNCTRTPSWVDQYGALWCTTCKREIEAEEHNTGRDKIRPTTFQIL